LLKKEDRVLVTTFKTVALKAIRKVW